MSMTIATTELTLDTETVDTIAILEAEAAASEGTTPARAEIVWSEADSGLWVASYGGYYGGTVDQQNGHFFASDTFGQYVGDFRTLDEAQGRLGAHLHVMLPGVIRPIR
ncbi:hypothetical protein [Curtobacterium sp. Leaf261]|uniref:hypothetical protein n=1 Tax=Curtobacterium sp. Leaf261 TaxID=1736311 RepID=UPI0006F77A81|nr:hypothetical protein [Curtobacterium sp. Leaf261]KQO61440.1 hypothetical protein ASF23_13305 [Curtobacterium sp. Leaf261]